MEALEDVLIATVNGNSSLEINYTLTTSNIGKGFLFLFLPMELKRYFSWLGFFIVFSYN